MRVCPARRERHIGIPIGTDGICTTYVRATHTEKSIRGKQGLAVLGRGNNVGLVCCLQICPDCVCLCLALCINGYVCVCVARLGDGNLLSGGVELAGEKADDVRATWPANL
jgi:hypothetical protein